MTPEVFSTQNLTLADGRVFTSADDDSGRLVCVLGFDLAAKLFPRGSPLGESVKFRGIAYKVVGVLEQRGALFGQSRDNFIAVPLGTARRLYGENLSMRLQVQAPSRADYDATVDQARGAMRAMRRVAPGDEDDFEILSNESAVAQFRSLTSAIRLGVAAISSIALIAAGIGIMNIMLVSVTERTREIGIRRAIGARKRSVMLQFIAEAVLLSEVGGALGVVGGILFGNLLSFVVKAPPVIPWDWVGIGLAICSAVGILFGTYPAWKAAHLDPIDSLRYE
jgi:putative ABC transport system permease protein